MWREPLAVYLAFDHELAAGVGQPDEGAVAEDRVGDQAQPILNRAVGVDPRIK